MVTVIDRDEFFRREIREDSLTRERSLYLPELVGDLNSQISIDGERFKPITNGRANGWVTTPKTTLVLLEQRPEIVGYGTNERRGAFGSDEGILIDRFTLNGIELLVETMISRSLELFSRAHNHENINQFYAFGSYNPRDHTLTGRLLATKEVMPRIEKEIDEFISYLVFHSGIRCKGCDVKKEEHSRMYAGKTRFVLSNPDFISGAPFGSNDHHSLRIFPYSHTPRLTDLTKEQVTNLVSMLYKLLEAFPHVITSNERFYHTVDFAMHSAPMSGKDMKLPEDTAKRILSAQPNGRDAESMTKLLEKTYHFHVEIGLGNIPTYGSPWKIPFSGLEVIPGRPVSFAERFRNYLNHQP